MAKNFAYSNVATAPSPATSGTSLVVTAADGTKFPPTPFPATIWPVGVRPTTANAEIVTVTTVSTDTFTIVRAMDDSTARTVIIGDQIAATATANLMVQNNMFTADSATIQDVRLTAATEFVVPEKLEVGSAYSLEIPSDSSLEVSTYAPYRTQNDAVAIHGIYDFIESGCVWSGDAYGVNLNASMTSGFVWLAGQRLRVNAVNSRAFTASKDVHVDFSDAGNGFATITYIDGTTNAASTALPAGSLRNALIVTGASSIAAATSVNQGQETMVLPIASSIAYSVTDSLGNLICPRDPNRRILGYRQIIANIGSLTSTSDAQVTGLSCPVIVPTARKIQCTVLIPAFSNTSAAACNISIYDGVVNSGPLVDKVSIYEPTTGTGNHLVIPGVPVTPTTASKTYNVGYNVSAGTGTLTAAATTPAYIKIELG